MVTTSRGHPRFLPTLTEVVQVSQPPPKPPVDLAALEAMRSAAFAERIRAQLSAALDARMQDAVADAMLEQVDAMGDRLRRQMEDMVRESLDTITDRLRGELDAMVRESVQAVLAVSADGVAADGSESAPPPSSMDTAT